MLTEFAPRKRKTKTDDLIGVWGGLLADCSESAENILPQDIGSKSQRHDPSDFVEVFPSLQDIVRKCYAPIRGYRVVCSRHGATEWQVEEPQTSGVSSSQMQIESRTPSSPWVDTSPLSELEGKLEPLFSLEDNWDDYGAPAPSRHVLVLTQRILKWLAYPPYRPSGIVPSAEGGVALCFRRSSKYSHIELLNSGEATLLMYEGNGEPIIQELGQSPSEISRALVTIREYLAD